MALQDRHGNHNDYRGPLLAKINLTQVTAINAPDFAVIDLPEERWGGGGGGGSPFTGLRELTIRTGFCHSVAVEWATTGATVLRRLSSLTIRFGHFYEFVQALPTEKAVGARLRRLSLQGVLLELTKLVEQLIVPLTTTTPTTTKVEGVIHNNDRLEELRVAWWWHDFREKVKRNSSAPDVRFPALTTLHLVRYNLLHR